MVGGSDYAAAPSGGGARNGAAPVLSPAPVPVRTASNVPTFQDASRSYRRSGQPASLREAIPAIANAGRGATGRRIGAALDYRGQTVRVRRVVFDNQAYVVASGYATGLFNTAASRSANREMGRWALRAAGCEARGTGLYLTSGGTLGSTVVIEAAC